MKNKPTALMIFGPTAAGKTALGIALAKHFDGVIINADSRQVFKDMPILTAAPSKKEYAAAPHKLFEFLEPTATYSAAAYAKDAAAAAKDVVASGKMPIFVGGTGFYLKVLEEGISPMPDVPEKIITKYNKRFEKEGAEKLFAELQKVDKTWANSIASTNKQRIIRGLAVFEATGQKFSDFQKLKKQGGLDYNFIKIGIAPEKEIHVKNLELRFDLMLKAGLLQEVEDVTKKYKLSSSSMTSLGLKDFASYLQGDIPIGEAVNKYLTTSWQYSKRQLTWLKGQYKADVILNSGKEVDRAIAMLKLKFKL